MRRFACIASGLFACVTGCGDDGGTRHLADAPPTPDTPIDAIPSGTVNVTALAKCCDVPANTPRENAVVVAVNADGNVAGTAMTDAQGKAAVTIKEGGSVTVAYPEDNDRNTYLTTYVGVKPDDALTFGDNYYWMYPGTGESGTMTVNWSAYTGATSYQVYNRCNSNSNITALTTSIGLAQDCQTPTGPVTLLAYDTDGNLIASAYVANATTTPNATVTVPAGAWVAQTQNNVTVSFTGAQAGVYEARLNAYAWFGNYSWSNTQYVTPKAGAGSTTMTIPTAQGAIDSEVRLYRNNYGSQNYYKKGASPLAFATGTLPWISGIIFSPADNHLLWLQTQGTYDAAMLYLNWTHYDGKFYHYYYWNIVLPPGQTEFELGTPPAELAQFLPTGDDSVGYDLEVIDLSSAATYDAARNLPEWRLSSADSAVLYGDEVGGASVSEAEGGEGFTFTAAKSH